MRKKTLLVTASMAIIYLTTSSYSTGPAHGLEGNKTGANGGETCAKCHSGGTGTTTALLELHKKSWGIQSNPVNYYEAGETYIVTIKGASTNTNHSHFGFQLTTLNSSNAAQGTYGALPTNVHGYPNANPEIIEHSMAIPRSSANEYVVSFEWTAPATAQGPLTMYYIINAVNNDGSDGGDVPSSGMSLSLSDKTSVEKLSNQLTLKAYPNPVQETLTLDLEKADPGAYSVQVYTTGGALVEKQDVEIYSGAYSTSINTNSWAKGMYFVQIIKDGDRRVLPILKQ